jgi:hypothetical protein
MNRYYNINPFGRRYTEEELRQIRKRYLVKGAEPNGASRTEERERCQQAPFKRVASGQLLMAAGRLLGLGG